MIFGKEQAVERAIARSVGKQDEEQRLDPLETWHRVYRLIELLELQIVHDGMQQTIVEELRSAKERHGCVVILDIMGFGSYFQDLQEQYGLCDVGIGVCLGDNRTLDQRSVDADRGLYRVARNILTPQDWEGVDAIFMNRGIAYADEIVFFPGAGGDSTYITKRVDVFSERIFEPMWDRLHPDGGILHMEIPDHIMGHAGKGFSRWFETVSDLMPEAQLYESQYKWNMLRLVKSPATILLPDLRKYLR